MPSKKKSLFEILNDGLKQARKEYNITIPWYIMTSHTNDSATRKFFKEKKFFGYPEDCVKFFIQDKCPVLDINGKLMLSEPYLINEASNGNGNIYKALAKSKQLEDLKSRKIKWVFVCGIDNVLLKVVDPLFLGLLINSGLQIASKTRFKETSFEKECVFCKRNHKPSILNYWEITAGLSDLKDESGNFLYREANVLSHLFSIEAIENLSTVELPYHRAFKRNTFVNEEGMKQVPESNNSFKFETFIFDAFSFFDDLLLFRVNKDEFAPIKNNCGLNSPEVATKLYVKHHY